MKRADYIATYGVAKARGPRRPPVAERINAEIARAAPARSAPVRQHVVDHIPAQQQAQARGRIIWLDVPVPIGATGRLRIVGYDSALADRPTTTERNPK